MNDDTNGTRTLRENLKPYMLGYTVKAAGNGSKSYWSKVGIAWVHKDGLGYNVQMDALPVDGKLVLRTVLDEDVETGELLAPTPEGMN